jgi:small subunit ribosomal protein S18
VQVVDLSHVRAGGARSADRLGWEPDGVASKDALVADLAELRFDSDRGKIRSRRVTGVTPRQQRRLAAAIKNAREMALLPYGSKPTR